MKVGELIEQLVELRHRIPAVQDAMVVLTDGDAAEWEIDHIHVEGGVVYVEITIADDGVMMPEPEGEN